MSPDTTPLPAHRAAICDDFLSHTLRAECSCGWTGELANNQREALADWAAHVHVAEGRAVADA